MAIGMVELQGSINRTQDFQTFQQHENDKGLIQNANQQVQVEQRVEQNAASVHAKEDAAADTDADGREGNASYGGDGGRRRDKKNIRPVNRVVEKKPQGFDIKI